MNKRNQPMTLRTIGLLSFIAVLSVSVFSAALILTNPNPSTSSSNGPASSDTKSLDTARMVANVSNDRVSIEPKQSPTNQAEIDALAPAPNAPENRQVSPANNNIKPATSGSTQSQQRSSDKQVSEQSSSTKPTNDSNEQFSLNSTLNKITDNLFNQ